jgi:hypothetical protein
MAETVSPTLAPPHECGAARAAQPVRVQPVRVQPVRVQPIADARLAVITTWAVGRVRTAGLLATNRMPCRTGGSGSESGSASGASTARSG